MLGKIVIDPTTNPLKKSSKSNKCNNAVLTVHKKISSTHHELVQAIRKRMHIANNVLIIHISQESVLGRCVQFVKAQLNGVQYTLSYNMLCDRTVCF